MKISKLEAYGTEKKTFPGGFSGKFWSLPKKQYERENREREEALQLLASVQYRQQDIAKDLAFRIGMLVKLTNPTIENASQQLHVKNAFVRGLHPEIQMKVKTLENFAALDMNLLLDHTVRLEVAGMKS